MTPPEDRFRVFFALWPQDPLRAHLARVAAGVRDSHGGRAMRPDTLHLTLVFVGGVDRGQLPDLMRVAAGVRVPGFELMLDRLDCWRRNRIAHLRTSRPPETLFDLVRQLESGLERAGVAFDRRNYLPHVTLIRGADCTKENPAPEPMRWPARDFVLVNSSLRAEGARFQELGRWPLL